MVNTSGYFRDLNTRRRELGMSYAVVAKRSGVSLPTVVRVLSGRYPQASFANVAAVAQTLGMPLTFDTRMSPNDVREQQAQRKARSLVGMVQGTSALEGQGVDEQAIGQMTRQTCHELLAGSRFKLWSD